MRVGYQGDVGSNSEIAAKIFVEKNMIKEAELLPQITSENVLSSLETADTEYGVVAVRNSIGGTVVETFNSLRGKDFELADVVMLDIKHYLFTRSGEEVTRLVSHDQVFRQTSYALDAIFSDIDRTIVKDQALAAKELSKGCYPEGCGVICTESVGKLYDLVKYGEIPTNSKSITEFYVYKRRVTGFYL